MDKKYIYFEHCTKKNYATDLHNYSSRTLLKNNLTS